MSGFELHLRLMGSRWDRQRGRPPGSVEQGLTRDVVTTRRPNGWVEQRTYIVYTQASSCVEDVKNF